MPNRNWYETSEDLLMPLPLTEDEVNLTMENLTEEVVKAPAPPKRRFR